MRLNVHQLVQEILWSKMWPDEIRLSILCHGEYFATVPMWKSSQRIIRVFRIHVSGFMNLQYFNIISEITFYIGHFKKLHETLYFPGLPSQPAPRSSELSEFDGLHFPLQCPAVWLLQILLWLFNIPCPCRELNEQASASQSLGCRLCLMMSWITKSAQRRRFGGRTVTHYGKQPPRPLYLIDFEWAKLSINFGHGVINVKKREENRQTNFSSVIAALMVPAESVWGESEGEASAE